MKVSEKEILHYLGYHNGNADEHIISSIKELIPTLIAYATPKYIYGKWNINELTSSTVKLEGITINSKGLSRHLQGCEQIVIIGATLGSKIDNFIRKFNISNMQKAVIADTICNSMIEAYCDEIQDNIIKDVNLYPASRYSPGYDDFDLKYQQDILDLLNSSKRIGLSTASNSYMLTPMKSITAIIGLSKNKIECVKDKCKNCSKFDCNFRRKTDDF